jgi:hypothetical protein
MFWFTKQSLLMKLKKDFKLFYDVFSQNDTERELLYDRLGHTRHSQDSQFANLVESLHQFLQNPDTDIESKYCTDQMLLFHQIGIEPTEMTRFITESSLQIEQKFKAAQEAMLHYRYEIVSKKNKTKQSGKKFSDVHTLAEMRVILNNT